MRSYLETSSGLHCMVNTKFLEMLQIISGVKINTREPLIILR